MDSDLDEIAMRMHGTYITELTSSDYDSESGESDFDEEYSKNKPPPEILENKSFVVCEPFHPVKSRKKIKPLKGPKLIVTSLPKPPKKRPDKKTSKSLQVLEKSTTADTEKPPVAVKTNKGVVSNIRTNNKNAQHGSASKNKPLVFKKRPKVKAKPAAYDIDNSTDFPSLTNLSDNNFINNVPKIPCVTSTDCHILFDSLNSNYQQSCNNFFEQNVDSKRPLFVSDYCIPKNLFNSPVNDLTNSNPKTAKSKSRRASKTAATKKVEAVSKDSAIKLTEKSNSVLLNTNGALQNLTKRQLKTLEWKRRMAEKESKTTNQNIKNANYELDSKKNYNKPGNCGSSKSTKQIDSSAKLLNGLYNTNTGTKPKQKKKSKNNSNQQCSPKPLMECPISKAEVSALSLNKVTPFTDISIEHKSKSKKTRAKQRSKTKNANKEIKSQYIITDTLFDGNYFLNSWQQSHASQFSLPEHHISNYPSYMTLPSPLCSLNQSDAAYFTDGIFNIDRQTTPMLNKSGDFANESQIRIGSIIDEESEEYLSTTDIKHLLSQNSCNNLELVAKQKKPTIMNTKTLKSQGIQAGCGYKQLHSTQTQTDDCIETQNQPNVPNWKDWVNFSRFFFEHVANNVNAQNNKS